MTTETLPAVAPFEPTTPIKPSEAIRLGCLIAPVQEFEGPYFNAYIRSACAYGAMALGLGGWDSEGDPDGDRVEGKASSLHHNLEVGDCPEPECVLKGDPAHLNDDHRWSRERIADWLAEQGL
jgi:hypothetical protein